jgi:hypothetical protein
MKNRHLLFQFIALICGAGLFLTAVSWIEKYENGWDSLKGKTVKEGVTGASDYLFNLRKNQVTGMVDLNDVLKARTQVEMAGPSPRNLELQWQELGPDNFAGRTRALLIDSRDGSGKTLFAGSVSGGIWKTTNGGQTWNKVNGSEDNPNISCLVQTSNGTIYAGTGEYFISTADEISRFNGFISKGIYRSTDGENFEVIPSSVPDIQEGTASMWAFVNKLAVDQGSGRIYAALNGGLVYSDDGFATFAFARSNDGQDLDTTATDVDVASNGLVVAAVGNWCYISENGAPSNFVNQSLRYYQSPDTLINENKLPRDLIARIEFAIAPSNSDVIYAMTASAGDGDHQLTYGELEGIYLSEDKGQNWMVAGPGGSDEFNVLGQFGVFLGFYNNTITVHPTDPFTVLVGGIDMWQGSKVNGTGYYNWAKKSSSIFDLFPTYIHSNHHIYVYNQQNPEVCYAGSDGGVFVTDDGFNTFRAINRQIVTSQFYSVGYGNEGKVIGGTQGNGIIYLDMQGNTPETGVQIVSGINAGYQDISMIMPNCFILSGQALDMIRSDDYGQNASPVFIPGSIVNPDAFITPFALWECFNNQNSRDSVTFVTEQSYQAGEVIRVESYNNDYPFDYVTPVDVANGEAITVQDIISTRFFLPVKNAVYISKEVLDFTKEPEFFKIAVIQGTPLCIAYSKDANYVYVGTETGLVYRIANLAFAYNLETADVSSTSCVVATTLIKDFAGRAVTSLAVDPNNDNHVIVTLGNYGNTDYVYRTTNAIDSLPAFASIQGNLPHLPVYSSLIEMSSSNRLIIGTEYGIWTTGNPGENTTWARENNGMGDVPVFMLRQQLLSQWPINNYGVIYAASFGRGLFKSENFVGIDDFDHTSPLVEQQIQLYPNPADDQVNVSFELDHSGTVQLQLFDLNGRKIFDVIKMENAIAGDYIIPVDCQDLRPGTYIIHMIAGNKSASSKFVVVR